MACHECKSQSNSELKPVNFTLDFLRKSIHSSLRFKHCGGTNMTNLKPVAVFGATGHTGRFVAAELASRCAPSILVGREATRLAECHPAATTRVAKIDDAASMDAALHGAGVVINCAGPFFDTALPVIDAAIRAGIPYLDVTAEQSTVLRIRAERDAVARAAGVAIMPAMAFYGGLGDLLTTVACANWLNPDSIEIAVALDRWHPTPGTRETGRRNTAARLIVRDGQLLPLPASVPSRDWAFPAPFGSQEVVAVPLTETVLIAQHIAVKNMTTFMNRAPLEDLHDPATPPPVAADASGRSAQRFVVDVVVRNGSDERRVQAAGRDIYAVTAPLVVEAALRLIRDPLHHGVLSPGEVFDARNFLEALAPMHLDLSFS
jgi:short subunit dehydrogenase-like uncharacterized protein